MRIAEVSPYNVSVPGGVQGQVFALSKALRDLGHEVDIIAPLREQTIAEEVISVGGSLSWAANGSVAPVSISPTAWTSVRRALQRGAYDVVHIHEPLTPLVGLAALRSAGGFVAATFHRSGVSAVYRLWGTMLSGTSRRIDVRFAVSEEAARTAKAVCGGELHVVGNGVDLSRFREAKSWESTTPVVMFIGRHEHRKGLGVLLDAFSQMSGEVELWIAGDGPETAELRGRFRNDQRLRWLGRISDAEASSRMKAADILCAPSLYAESFGVVLLEGMAAGAVVVASDISGYNGVVTNGRDGILVPAGDSGALAMELSRLLAEPDRRAELRAHGEARAESFSMVRLAKTYLEYFSEGERLHGT